MQGFIKTLFGDARNVAVAAICISIAALLLITPAAIVTGLVLPIALLAGAAYLAQTLR